MELVTTPGILFLDEVDIFPLLIKTSNIKCQALKKKKKIEKQATKKLKKDRQTTKQIVKQNERNDTKRNKPNQTKPNQNKTKQNKQSKAKQNKTQPKQNENIISSQPRD